MLLLMRRVGEAIRIHERILIEIQDATEDQVTFVIHGTEEKEVKTISNEDANE